MPVYQIINVISMRHCFVSTTRAMDMVGIVAIAFVIGRATIGVFRGYFKDMLFNMFSVQAMELTIMKIINVSTVPYRKMSAIWTMVVFVVRMCLEGIGGFHKIIYLNGLHIYTKLNQEIGLSKNAN